MRTAHSMPTALDLYVLPMTWPEELVAAKGHVSKVISRRAAAQHVDACHATHLHTNLTLTAWRVIRVCRLATDLCHAAWQLTPANHACQAIPPHVIIRSIHRCSRTRGSWRYNRLGLILCQQHEMAAGNGVQHELSHSALDLLSAAHCPRPATGRSAAAMCRMRPCNRD